MKKNILFLLFAIAAMAAHAKDIKTMVVTTTPIMHCESCENKIKNNLRFEKGIKKIETDISNQAVTITYDADKNTQENIIKAFGKFGYEAEIKTDGENCCDKTDGTGTATRMLQKNNR